MNHNLEKKTAIGLALTVLLIILVGVYFITEPARQRSAREEFTRKASAVGAELYLVNGCAACHGQRGQGIDAPSLRDTKLDEEVLIKTISRGRPGTEMPAWSTEDGGVFTQYQIRDIAEFIRHWDDNILEEKRQELIEQGTLTPTPTPPPPNAAGGEGLQLFQQFGCAACHTIEGVSTGTVGPELTHIGSDAGQRVTGTVAKDYIEESLLNPGAFVVEGYPPIMPGFDGRLTPEELQALVDYLLSLK